MVEEILRKIEGYNYYVSNYGRVYNPERKAYLTPRYTPKRYQRVCLYKEHKRKEFFVHVLVAKSFPEICGIWFEGAQCNHINEVHDDNRAENIEVCTAKYNINFGTRTKRQSKTRSRQIYCTFNGITTFYLNTYDAAKKLGFSVTSIYHWCNKKKKPRNGSEWGYK